MSLLAVSPRRLLALTSMLLLAAAAAGPGPAQAASNNSPQCTAVMAGGAGLGYPSDSYPAGKVESGELERGYVICRDPEGQPLTFSRGAGPSHGKVSSFAVRNDTDPATPTVAFLYRSTAGYLGQDRFFVKVTDGNTTVRVQLAFTVVAATDDAPTCLGNVGILDGEGYDKAPSGKTVKGSIACTDDEGVRLKYAVETQAAHGTVRGFTRFTEADRQYGEFTYTSVQGYIGPDTFKISARDASNKVVKEFPLRVVAP